jgi:hypothetical protein
MPKWVKGQSGNPNGRPRRTKMMTDELKCLLNKTVWPFQRSARDLIALRLVDLAIREGDIKAIQYIYDRLDGKPAQAVEVSGDKKRPLVVQYVNGNRSGLEGAPVIPDESAKDFLTGKGRDRG